MLPGNVGRTLRPMRSCLSFLLLEDGEGFSSPLLSRDLERDLERDFDRDLEPVLDRDLEPGLELDLELRFLRRLPDRDLALVERDLVLGKPVDAPDFVVKPGDLE